MTLKTLKLFLLFTLGATAAHAVPVQWAVADGGNGHWYDISSSTAIGSDAAAAAAAQTIVPGGTSYLATITSAAEWAFVTSNFSYNMWISGSDAASEGTWVYNSGPEEGQLVSFFNWYGSEPNNAGNEDYLQMYSTGFYNDNSATHTLLYLIEAEIPAVPLPATGLLLGGALSLFGLRRRRRAS